MLSTIHSRSGSRAQRHILTRKRIFTDVVHIDKKTLFRNLVPNLRNSVPNFKVDETIWRTEIGRKRIAGWCATNDGASDVWRWRKSNGWISSIIDRKTVRVWNKVSQNWNRVLWGEWDTRQHRFLYDVLRLPAFSHGVQRNRHRMDHLSVLFEFLNFRKFRKNLVPKLCSTKTFKIAIFHSNQAFCSQIEADF